MDSHPQFRARHIGRNAFVVLVAVLLLSPGPLCAATQLIPSDRIVGDVFSHTVMAGDTLSRIGARYGVDAATLATLITLDDPDVLVPGQSLRVDNRHIVPEPPFATGIVINLPQRMLFHFEDGQLSGAWPVAVGSREWPTPTGMFNVRTRQTDPTWYVPETIREELRRQSRPVVTEVPPCPENPLGAFWIGLGDGLGIHGTNQPGSIYGLRTHGCVRLHPNDIEALFPDIKVETPVWITDQPVLVARLPDRSAYLEAHPGAYFEEAESDADTRAMILEALGDVSMEAVAAVLAEHAGIARPVE